MNPKNQSLSFVLAFMILFALFSGLGFLLLKLGWDWTLAKLIICIVTVSGVIIAWSQINKVSLARAIHDVGFGAPEWRVVGVAVVTSALMLAFFPLYSSLAGVNLVLQGNWLWITLGIITGVGVAEETLFRGFVFNFYRERYSFWKAATYSMFLFGAMHLLLVLWLPIPIAIAAILLAIIAAYPTAYLFEQGNRTIWPSAIMHSAALATNLFVIPLEISVSLSLLWIGDVLVCLFLVFLVGRLFFSNQLKEQFNV